MGRFGRLLALPLVMVLGLSSPARAESGNVTLASTSDTGVKGNDWSTQPSISADATKVAFGSGATNLDPADTDVLFDIYLKDLVTGDITLASTSDGGAKGDGQSFFPFLSAAGTRVAFESGATNLDPADGDSIDDVYVKDLTTGDITLASTSDTGVKGNDRSTFPWLSRDGTKVAFFSDARNLDPADSDFEADIYVKDLGTGDIILASTSKAGVKGNDGSFSPSLSADGTRVAFSSGATNLDPADTDARADIYVKDLVTGDVTLASTSDTGVKGNRSSISPSLSADGTKVAFYSDANRLDPADTDFDDDVYVKDLGTGDIILASTSKAGVKGNGHSIHATLSADGTKVAFSSAATNLHPADTDDLWDVYLKTLATGRITLASTSDTGVKGNHFSYVGSVSANGTWVAFQSFATNLDPADSDSLFDVYLKRAGRR
jgi:Tol biopolymer transport system component